MQQNSSINNTSMSLEEEIKITKEEETMVEKEKTSQKKLLKFSRFFTDENVHPFDEIEWTTTRVLIKNLEGKKIFDHEVEHPTKWNEMAVRTCADKYFKTHNLENHIHGGERSVRDVIHRVAYSVAHRGVQMEYFDEENSKILYDELCYLMINQIGAFNSPVFFNWGLYDVYNFKGNSKAKRWAIKDKDKEVFQQEFEYENPQGSACKSGDTWIYTNKGPMYLEDLVTRFNEEENDIKVMSSSGFSNVIAAKFNGIKPTYKVVFKDGNELRITEEDEIFIQLMRSEEDFLSVKEILEIDSKNFLSVQAKSLLEDNYCPAVEISAKELKQYEFNSEELENGIPNEIKFGKKEEVIEYLKVAFESNGSLVMQGQYYSVQWSVSSKILAYDMFHMLRNLNIFSKIKNKQDTWTVIIGYASEVRKFRNIIGFTDDSKKEKLDDNIVPDGNIRENSNFWSALKSVEYYGEEKVYDIETEAHDFYANGILVHNCFITEVNDELVNGENGIYDWIQTEMSIFANGSGSGLNASKIRGRNEYITGGGKSSGLISFLEVADASAGVIKSGGKCLAPDQYVYTQNGPVKAKDLDEKEFICLSYDPPSARFKAKKAKCWKSGIKKLIEIVTDNGRFTLSEDHPVKLSCGKTLLANKLKIGQSLFDCKIYDSSESLRVSLKDKRKGRKNLHELIAEDILNWNLKNRTVSHKDNNKFNNNIDNLELLSNETECEKIDDKKIVKKINKIDHRIIEINILEESDVYSVEVECSTLDDKSKESGHNFVIWPNEKVTGSGIVVFNTRRAAKMIILDDNHPDLIEFIDWKKDEEFKARALMLMGYAQNWSDEKGAYKTVQAQNANNSIALTDKFMQAVINDEDWDLKYVTTGKIKETIKARDILEKIVEANWECGDPGVFFIDTINNWNTIPNTGPIRSSNPCITGDTLIATADGRNAVSIKQLAKEGKDVPVYCLDNDKQIAVRWMRNPRKTGENKKILKVEFENGLIIRCTEDHKFITQNGDAVRADQLKSCQSNVQILKKWQKTSKEWIINNNEQVIEESKIIENEGFNNITSAIESPVVYRKCEFCENIFPTIWENREISFCSKSCSDKACNINNFENVRAEKYDTISKIIDVTEDGYEDVYNGTVDEFHNFAVANYVTNDLGISHINAVFTKNCGEFLQPDNSSCNLASLNLVRFLNKDKTFNIEAFKASIEYFITAMEIIVGGSSYPSKKIAEMTKNTRPLGLGYCNMGGLIMILGYPYDSDQAHSIISTITSLETSTAYAQSSKIAAVVGPFKEYNNNKQEFINIMKKHRDANLELKPRIKFAKQIHQAAIDSWNESINLIQKYGIRNSQAVVIAPTGCVTGDTLILSSEGLLPISEIGNVNGNEWQDININVIKEKNITNADKFYVNGLDRTFKIVTERGHSIKSTWKHQFRVVNELGDYTWKKAEDINKNDLLVLGYNGHSELLNDKQLIKLDIVDKNLPDKLDEQTAELLGYYMGDGYLDKENVLKFTINNEDKDLISYFNEWLNKIGAKTDVEESYCNITNNVYCSNLYAWFKLNGFIKNEGNYGEYNSSSFIPINILRSKTSVVCSFLRGLFEANGCIHIDNKSCSIDISTSSELFNNQIHSLLESLGILCISKEANIDNNMFKTIITGYNVKLFMNKIGFLSSRKNNILEFVKNNKCLDEITQEMRINHKILIDDLYENALKIRNLPKNILRDIEIRKNIGNFSSCWVYDLLLEFPELKESKIGVIFSQGDLQLVPVKSCKYNRMELTYDISVPDGNTYRANGFISHNTIMFLMGTTNNGIEPSYSLCTYKLMSDGSVVELLCEEAKVALLDLGHNKQQVDEISEYILQNGTVEGAPHLSAQHYPIFDTANVDGNGVRCIKMSAHVDAIAAATPFISGGISKTTNLPENATKDDIRNCYIEAWKKGCKGLALYRSGSKWSQPLNSKNSKFKKETIKREIKRTKERLSKSDFNKTSPDDFWEFHRGLLTRKKAADRAQSERLNFSIGSENVWMNIVRFPNNGVSEIWLEVGKENPTVNGLADTIGRICSIAIQYGVPIEAICSTMQGLQFNPAGFLRKNDLGIRSAKSLSDLTSQVLTKLHAEYNGLEFEEVTPVWNNDIELEEENYSTNGLKEEPRLISESEQAKAKGFSGIRCERCGSWRTKGSIKCGLCLSCQTPYGTCGE